MRTLKVFEITSFKIDIKEFLRIVFGLLLFNPKYSYFDEAQNKFVWNLHYRKFIWYFMLIVFSWFIIFLYGIRTWFETFINVYNEPGSEKYSYKKEAMFDEFSQWDAMKNF